MNTTRITQQLRSFERLLEAYDKREPLSRFLTLFFKANRQMGSNDRKTLSRWIYSYFRLGKAFADLPILERLAVAEYLCSGESALLQVLNQSLSSTVSQPLEKKITLLEEASSFQLDTVFPLIGEASPSLEKEVFLKSLFRQPDLFIRIHPGKEQQVTQLLAGYDIAYRVLDKDCIALPNGTKLNQYTALDGSYEVQDLSSQQTATYFKARQGESWWDACAASGGKSLLLLQRYPGVDLLVSDVRSSILRNLDERFDKAGIRKYRRKIIDLTKDTTVILGTETFDGVLLDAPCSGSGTWGRTPEMMQSFHAKKLEYFTTLQRTILDGVIQHLKLGAPLIYITCSIYAAENEQQVAYLQSKGLVLEQMELLKGYHNRADTMFVARLIKR